MENTEKLQEIQDELRTVDYQLVLLLNQRADFATELNILKQEMGLPLYDKMEENSIMEELENTSAYTNMINAIYPSILKYARTLYED